MHASCMHATTIYLPHSEASEREISKRPRLFFLERKAIGHQSRVPHATPHTAGEGVQARANARASNRALRPWRSPTLPVLPIDTGAAALHFPPEAPFPRPVGAPRRSLVAQLEHFEKNSVAAER